MKKNGSQISSKEITDETSIFLKKLKQSTNISSSVFTKQKVPLHKGLNLRANVTMALDSNQQQLTDGIAIIIQNHPEGNKYVGDHGTGLGVKNIKEKCAGLTIKAFQNDNKSNLIINFADQEIFNKQVKFVQATQQLIYLQIQILENDEALLTFRIGSDSQQTGPQTPLKLLNFRKSLCLQEKEDLSAFVGFSSSQLSESCEHYAAILFFKLVESDCGCPSDDSFPLKVIYKKPFTQLQANEDLSISIEEPKICNQCEDYQGNERDINLLLDYTWKLKGKKIIIDNKTFIEFQLPYISGSDEQSNKHLLSFLVDEISFDQKQFSIVPNSFLQEKWKFQFINPDSKNDQSQSYLPLTGFFYNKTTQPPNIPPLDDKAKLSLSQKQENFYVVDIYSRPIIKGKQESSLLELSNERIKIDSIKNEIENSDNIVQVKEWIPQKEINIFTDKYVLQGQCYEYEIKHEDGSLIQLIRTQPEIALDTLYDGVCYGNYCKSFFCKQNVQDGLPPISQLDKVCKEMNENTIGSRISTLLGIAELGPNKLIARLSSKISKIFLLDDLNNIRKVFFAQCSENDMECKIAKYAIIGEILVKQLSLVGKINLFFDVFNMLVEGGHYLISKLGKWIKSKFTGDPHIKNLDGCQFDFQGQGDFVLLEEKIIGFAIHSRFLQHSSFKHVTTIKSIAIRAFWGAPLVQFESLLNEKKPLIRINGLIVKIENEKSFEIPNLTIKVMQENYYIEFSNGIQLQVTNHGYGFLWTGLATIPAVFSGKLQGILGNGDSENNQGDFQPGNNAQTGYEAIKSCKEVNAENIWKFGQSWRLTKKEDSILFYKKDEDPNVFFDQNWKPISTQEIIKQTDKKKNKMKLNNNANSLKRIAKKIFKIAFLICFYFKQKRKTHQHSKEQPQEKKIHLIYKNISESSAELEFGINNEVEQFCSKGCITKIFSKKVQESQFNLHLQLQSKTQQKTSQKISELDKHTQYTFKVQISDKSGSNLVSSNLVSLYTLKSTCVPFCAKQNACGDDGCGGQCVQKVQCSSECKFGVCEVRDEQNIVQISEQNSESSSKLKIILNSLSNTIIIIIITILVILSVTILIIIIYILIYFYRRKGLKKINKNIGPLPLQNKQIVHKS